MKWFKRKATRRFRELEWARHPNNEAATAKVAYYRELLYRSVASAAQYEGYSGPQFLIGFKDEPPVPLLPGAN